jgi:hypothetical protein
VILGEVLSEEELQESGWEFDDQFTVHEGWPNGGGGVVFIYTVIIMVNIMLHILIRE